MVASNPLFRKWSIEKFEATVINDIWPEVLFFSLIATIVSTVTGLTSHRLVLSPQLLTVLGTVLGLVISFRTSSAYERYQDGRKMWSNITVASRNIAQIFWIHVPFEREPKEGQTKVPELNCLLEKKSMINLTQAFSVAVKHYLRGEQGIYYQDLYPLICFLPRYATVDEEDTDVLPLWHGSEHEHNPSDFGRSSTLVDETPKIDRTSSLPYLDELADSSKEQQDEKDVWYASSRKKQRKSVFDPERVLPTVTSDVPLKPSRNPPKTTLYDYFPLLRLFKHVVRLIRRKAETVKEGNDTYGSRKKAHDTPDANIPLEIIISLSSYQSCLLRKELLPSSMQSWLTSNINLLQDTLANLDRIRNTPLPFAYQAHLRMSLWTYLFFLPFQIQASFRYLTIPATAFASFLLLGFLEIGQEIENPFNYDLNDLDLDTFCLSIQRELAEITAHTSPDPDTFIFTTSNQPFAPADRRTAKEIISLESDDPEHKSEYCMEKEDREKGLACVRRTMLKSWREVDKATRGRA